jgi:hypothetical protein
MSKSGPVWGRDFTPLKYERLIRALIDAGYRSLIPYEPSAHESNSLGQKTVILRHDVDRKVTPALIMAELENRYGLRSIFYYRKMSGRFNAEEIRSVSSLNHEIGYHYETLARAKGDLAEAFDLFQEDLAELRRIVPVRTVCMHGSPLSRWDNRALWNRYDYRESGILFEPYYDLDFNEVFYLTDTGRRWDGEHVAVRDKVTTKFQLHLRRTGDIISALRKGKTPARMMINAHPHHWHPGYSRWFKDLVWQDIKNVFKRYYIKIKK